MIRFTSIALVAFVTLVGCSNGGTSGAGGGSGAPLAFTDFCTKYVDAISGQLSTCNSGPKELWSKGLAQTVRCDEIVRAVDGGRAGYDGTAAQSCLTTVAGLSCTAILSSAGVPECVKTLDGKLPVGATCYGEIDCGEGKYCAGMTQSVCSGTCKTEIAAGVACASGDECVRGYYCSNSVCTLNPPDGTADVGASCSGSVNCKPGLVCDRLTSNCARPIKEGQPCTFGHGLCEFFTSCSSTTPSTCVRYATAGGACGTKRVADGGTDYESSSCLDSYCKIPPSSLTGTCAALVADMGVCTIGSECVSGICTASKCAPRCVTP
jgi:hypothetical protein